MKLESIGITLVSGRFANCQTSVCKQYIYIRYGDERPGTKRHGGRNDYKTNLVIRWVDEINITTYAIIITLSI